MADAQHVSRYDPFPLFLFYGIEQLTNVECEVSHKTAMGLSVPQAMLVIVVSRILIAAFSTLIAWIGLKWHIGFTVQNRYSWGITCAIP